MVTIGNLYKNQPCLLQSVTHTIENDSSWDIERELPMRVIANISLRLLDKNEYSPLDVLIYTPLQTIPNLTIDPDNIRVDIPSPVGITNYLVEPHPSLQSQQQYSRNWRFSNSSGPVRQRNQQFRRLVDTSAIGT